MNIGGFLCIVSDMSALIFMLILSFLVIIHELGHFLVARWAKIKVEEFGLGYPPRAITLFTDKLKTIYSLNWLPFGGFVRMMGEDSGEVVEGSFSSRPTWKRLLVVLAGASVNFVFGVIAFGVIYSQFGIPTQLGAVRVEGVAADSPAAEVGVPVGLMVTEVRVGDEAVEVRSGADLIEFVASRRGEMVTLVGENGETYDVYARKADEVPAGQGSLGIALNDMEMKHYPWWQMPFRGMWVGLQSAVEFGGLIVGALGTMIRDLVLLGQVPADVAGPVGIVYAAEKEGFLEEGIWAQLNFAAILSINLAIINVMPFPALDGGRAVFLVYELITRRKIKPKIEQWANAAGFMLLIGLIVLISFRDISRVIMDEGVRNWFGNLLGN